ncbi:alcohol dehydrogenase catalytic domain-containing protein [Novosphingobium sp. PhB57]|jgi:hypothetical protein|uniref:alcohol dehydrogenase catalytic domain-containing protein n=1 Tax=Novosphingobium sp. PhB57 TaxID=2485107 RepID=UPI001FB396FA|nr:alcohol dehydrogenase catalytic domain-containing protein [Novosphingobium sp. PhB57]
MRDNFIRKRRYVNHYDAFEMRENFNRGMGAVDRPEGRFDIEEIAIDTPKGREVLVQVKASGLCHSDLHLAEADFGTPLPAVLGPEPTFRTPHQAVSFLSSGGVSFLSGAASSS